jgi:AraC-like DNA-binding protein/ligand-binding sensor protein
MQIDSHKLLEALANSAVFIEFRQAFTAATGLPLALRAGEIWQPPLRGAEGESQFCAKLCAGGRFCTDCRQTQEALSKRGQAGPVTVSCWCGLAATAVPVRVSGDLIGFLQTGQVFLATPGAAELQATLRRMRAGKQPTDGRALRRAYLTTRVVPTTRYRACVGLLVVFAEHLGLVGEQFAAQAEVPESSFIRRAKAFMREHHDEPLRLPGVARVVNTSTFYFCKHFHKATGQHFSQFLCAVRLEKARNLLLNPDVRVSEIAYTVGFQSLTHFNRVFKQTTGLNPTQYRRQALAWHPLPKVTRTSAPAMASD